jgi:hypothetical protein
MLILRDVENVENECSERTPPLFNHRAARTAGSEAEGLGASKEQVWCLMGAMAGGEVITPECHGQRCRGY